MVKFLISFSRDTSFIRRSKYEFISSLDVIKSLSNKKKKANGE